MQAAEDMQVDDAEEMVPVHQADHFVFTAQKENLGPGNERGRNGSRRPRPAKHLTSAVRSVEQKTHHNLPESKETGSASLGQEDIIIASAMEEPQSGRKAEPVQKALSSPVIPQPHQYEEMAPIHKLALRGTPFPTLQRTILGELAPNSPVLGFGGPPWEENACTRLPTKDGEAVIERKEEPERGEVDDPNYDAEMDNPDAGAEMDDPDAGAEMDDDDDGAEMDDDDFGAATGEGKVLAGDESTAWVYQEEEEPQLLYQADRSSKLEALEEWLDLLEAVPGGTIATPRGFAEADAECNRKHQYSWKSILNKDLDRVKEGCKAGLKSGPRLQNVMNSLVEALNTATEYLSPRHVKQFYRRALSFRCLRRALRACFAPKDNRDQSLWLASAGVLMLMTRYVALLRKHIEYLRGIIDRFCVVGEMLRTDDAPLQTLLLVLTRALIDLVPTSDWLCLDPLLDVIIKQTVAQANADVSASTRVSPDDIDGVVRACALLMYCVRHHGTRLRPFVFRHGALEAVARLAGHAEPRVAMIAVEFLRACLLRHDAHYVARLMQGDLLAAAITTFRAASYARTSNDVTDAVRQLMHFILLADGPVAALKPNVRQLLFPEA
ncbi:hypothetical protein KFL_000050020 [Klebsormidium nitens]|uniref:Serine/threonine-protein phosphatase 4 regulatory subunit 3-like central domain-containing protein n=1 Tax=Klebsormidium nitens TaxID=105231 RepID=A0A1Y1HHD8_KLENI|nr:hypothetical protein KFL_000050020 [Klebsormidium nitens]|eukprot:GAQ77865.1 hypothetical protein KFL_000050020 [Klebsormidium nitens]